jgi:hypothetical protein
MENAYMYIDTEFSVWIVCRTCGVWSMGTKNLACNRHVVSPMCECVYKEAVHCASATPYYASVKRIACVSTSWAEVGEASAGRTTTTPPAKIEAGRAKQDSAS